ncbi:2-oxo acid dehydrogenase subunit E2 [Candidatus Legionella polyplacis]|uniref:Dihydrolipoamide acetyltransferase component of pyruvate dehydrogenase complex n=1 Tax=Candidatus Legionella polyplacis TaxID=2005262 RepID=A0ABZ2GXB1_9GAMM
MLYKKNFFDEKIISENKDIKVYMPDVKGSRTLNVNEIMVSIGQNIVKEQTLLSVESDKTIIEIPSPYSGVVKKILVNIGDQISKNSLLLILSVQIIKDSLKNEQIDESVINKIRFSDKKSENFVSEKIIYNHKKYFNSFYNNTIFATPYIRRIARKLNIDLKKIKGTGRKRRIIKKDIDNYLDMFKTHSLLINKNNFSSDKNSRNITFDKFGKLEIKSLNKIKQLSGNKLNESWKNIPHVTHFEKADVTELDFFRKNKYINVEETVSKRITILSFVIKILSIALKIYPQFNSSFNNVDKKIIYKYYYNIGIVINTKNGLVVPVIKNVNKLSITEIALKINNLSKKAHSKKLLPKDMEGGCFTVSNLGIESEGFFTPIINSPEVAILGISKAQLIPIYENGVLVPKLMLPLSFSYDHRVIDGVEAAKFSNFIIKSLKDIRNILL